MPAPTDLSLNDRIALAKGWKWVEFPSLIAPYHSVDGLTSFRSSVPTHWYNPEGVPAMRPDYVGTLEGVSGMMRELNEEVYSPEQRWVWGWSKEEHCYFFQSLDGYGGTDVTYDSPQDKPGECVGEAYEAERVYRWRGSTKEAG